MSLFLTSGLALVSTKLEVFVNKLSMFHTSVLFCHEDANPFHDQISCMKTKVISWMTLSRNKKYKLKYLSCLYNKTHFILQKYKFLNYSAVNTSSSSNQAPFDAQCDTGLSWKTDRASTKSVLTNEALGNLKKKLKESTSSSVWHLFLISISFEYLQQNFVSLFHIFTKMISLCTNVQPFYIAISQIWLKLSAHMSNKPHLKKTYVFVTLNGLSFTCTHTHTHPH